MTWLAFSIIQGCSSGIPLDLTEDIITHDMNSTKQQVLYVLSWVVEERILMRVVIDMVEIDFIKDVGSGCLGSSVG